jgi:hypothetical protein
MRDKKELRQVLHAAGELLQLLEAAVDALHELHLARGACSPSTPGQQHEGGDENHEGGDSEHHEYLDLHAPLFPP